MKLSHLIVSLSMLASGTSLATASSNEAIPIYTCEDLLAIPKSSTKSYKLASDIDCHGYELNNPILFKGSLYGENKTIYGLTIKSDSNYLGLFNLYGALIQDLSIDGFSVESTKNDYAFSVGILAGVIENGNILNVTIKNSKTVNQPKGRHGIGLIAGNTEGTKFQYIKSENNYLNTTSDSSRVGALIGYAIDNVKVYNATVINTKVIVKNELSGRNTFGGIIGALKDSELQYASIKDSSLYDADNGFHGANGLLVGSLNKSRILNAEIINVSSNFRKESELMNSAIAVGFINSEGNPLVFDLQNITTNDLDTPLPWFNTSSSYPYPNTKNLAFDESVDSTLPPDVCRL